MGKYPRLSDAVRVYLSAHALRLKSGHKLQQSINRDILPHLPDKRVHKIDRRDVGSMLNQHADRPATRALAYRQSRAMFRWMVNYGLAKRSPMEGMVTPPPVRARERVLTDGEISALWAATATQGGDFRAFYRLCLLTGQRRGEVAGMTVYELTGDAWVIPACRTKNGFEHTVYLPPLALEELHHGHKYLTAPDRDRPLSGFSRAHRRICEAMGVDDWSIHDLRRTARTGLAALGVAEPVLHRLFNHRSAIGAMDKVYDRYTYEKERRSALLMWSDHILSLVNNGS